MVKTYDYIIVLKKKPFSLIDTISKLMLLLGLAAFLFIAFSTFQGRNANLPTNQAWLLVIIAVFIIGWWVFCEQQLKRGRTPYFRFALMFAAWGWYVIPNGLWIAIVYIVACFLEKPIKVAPEVAFDNDEIVFNSFPQKKYTWGAISNIVLKDGLLTIDLKNNTLIQRAVDEAVPRDVEVEFNEFCKGLVESHKSLV